MQVCGNDSAGLVNFDSILCQLVEFDLTNNKTTAGVYVCMCVC